jgi:NADH pyrophosphatase NudC (nudix superfamily)
LFTVRAKQPGLGLLDLPGGFVDHNETLEHALSREIKEELGFDIDNWTYLQSGANTYLYNNITYFTCDAVFVTELTSLPTLSLQEEEIINVRWISLDEIPYQDMAFSSLRKILEQNASKLSSKSI